MELSRQAQEDLVFLGNFVRTAQGDSFKGSMWDEETCGATSVYLYASDFRNMAKSFAEVADLLESGTWDPLTQTTVPK